MLYNMREYIIILHVIKLKAIDIIIYLDKLLVGLDTAIHYTCQVGTIVSYIHLQNDESA